MPNGDSPSAPWDEKKSPQEKPIQQKDMLTDITSIFRREEYSTNTNCFTSQKVKECSVLPISRKQRDIFLLFPGEWHSYHPSGTKGWKSYWIGFKGKNIDDRVKAGFLSPEKPIYHVGYSNEIIALYEEAYKTAQEEVAFAQQTMAGIVNHLIGKMYSLERNIVLSKDTKHVDMINKARLRIRESLEDTLTIQEIAQELGISYSSFRKLFKEHTGFAPALYQQNLKLQRAKELLSTTDESIKEIAYRLNFESPDYFSAKFKIQTGMKPSDFRNMTR